MGLIVLKTSQSVALDTNIFIIALNKRDPRREKASTILEQIKEKGIRTSISVLVLEEFFIQVYKQHREKDSASILEFLSLGGLSFVLDVDREIALHAAKIRADYKSLRTPDAIHLASAIAAGASVFFSFDKRLSRKVEKLIIRQP